MVPTNLHWRYSYKRLAGHGRSVEGHSGEPETPDLDRTVRG